MLTIELKEFHRIVYMCYGIYWNMYPGWLPLLG